MKNESNSAPLVSVIIPTFNPCDFLEKAIASVFSQKYENIELIVVDDFSCDSSRKYISRLCDIYSCHLILLDKNSGGCAKPLNEGIKHSSGKYIAICAQDDLFIDSKIDCQVNYLEANPNYAMSYSDTYLILNNDQKFIKLKTPKRRSGKIFNDIILQKFYIPAVSVVIKRDVFDVIGYFDENLLIEDWDMWLRIAKKYEIGYLEASLAVYRSHNNNISKCRANEMISDRISIINKWNLEPVFDAALTVTSFLDGAINFKLPFPFIKNSLLAFWYLRQPIRWLKIIVFKIYNS